MKIVSVSSKEARPSLKAESLSNVCHFSAAAHPTLFQKSLLTLIRFVCEGYRLLTPPCAFSSSSCSSGNTHKERGKK